MRVMLGASFIASAAFLLLAVFGWNLPATDLLQFLTMLVILLMALVTLAAACVFFIKWLTRR